MSAVGQVHEYAPATWNPWSRTNRRSIIFVPTSVFNAKEMDSVCVAFQILFTLECLSTLDTSSLLLITHQQSRQRRRHDVLIISLCTNRWQNKVSNAIWIALLFRSGVHSNFFFNLSDYSFSLLSSFLFKNSALLLTFLFKVDGLFFFTFDLVDGLSPLVSKENKKEGPTLRVKVKVCPLPASAWQKAMHWEAKSESSSLIAAIFRLYLNHEFSLVSQKKTHVATFVLSSVPIFVLSSDNTGFRFAQNISYSYVNIFYEC